MRPKHYNTGFWTEEKLALLKQLRASGKSFEKISAAMGVSKNRTLSAWYRKIEKRKFKSDYANSVAPVASTFDRQPPTLAWVPGLEPTKAYKLEVFRDRMG